MLPPEFSDPLHLEHEGVALAPLSSGHSPALAALVGEHALWRDPYAMLPPPHLMQRYVQEALAAREAGAEVPFAILHGGRLVGMTRYQVINLWHRRLQVGSTWLAPPARRHGVNLRAKWLLLRHAFEQLRLRRVEFICHPANEAARASLLAMGITPEGVLRRHLFIAGASRDSAMYSVIDDEWPAVQALLLERMARQAAA